MLLNKARRLSPSYLLGLFFILLVSPSLSLSRCIL